MFVLVRVNVRVGVLVVVLVREAVAVFVTKTVVVRVGVLVLVEALVEVGGKVEAVTDPVGVTDSVELIVFVPNIPIGMTVAVPVETA